MNRVNYFTVLKELSVIYKIIFLTLDLKLLFTINFSLYFIEYDTN